MTTNITTKGGDKGVTSLYSGERVDKSDKRIKLVGIIDELVSFIGLARVSSKKNVSVELEIIQKDLFVLASEIATLEHSKLKKRIDDEFLNKFEEKHKKISDEIEFPKDFVLPGAYGSISGAYIDVARTVARRLETEMASELFVSFNLLRYVNRLSDFLWLLARLEEGKSKMQKD